MKKLVTVLVLAATVVLTIASMSEAICTVFGEVVRVNPGANATIYIRPNSITNFYWTATTANLQFQEAAVAAAANRTRVQAVGNVASCPTTSPTSGNPIGVLLQFVLAP